MTPEDARARIQDSNNRTTHLGSRTSKLGVEEHVGIPDDERLRHTLVIGPTGAGKTQAMVHAALQDAAKGHGLAMVVPKGGAIDEFLRKLPADRREDVVYINPATGTPGINVLEPETSPAMTPTQLENQKEIIVSDLIDLFKRQSENWGDRFGRVLETMLRAHLDLNLYHGESSTLLDVYRCVVNQDALVELIDRTQDSVIREQLVRIREDMGSRELEPVQRRLNDFVMNATIRDVIGAEESIVDFRAAVNDDRIVLVDVQKGEVGDTVSELVGSIVLTKIWAAAQSRIAQDRQDRRRFYLYVDELQNFAGEGSNFTTILAEAREYRLGCWLVTQYLRQLPAAMRRAVTNNCRTRLVFSPDGSDDITRIASMLRGVDKQQLLSLSDYRAALQTTGERQQRDAAVFDTYPPWTEDDAEVDDLKREATANAAGGSEREATPAPSLGSGSNAGGDHHRRLLTAAKRHLEEDRTGVEVDLLYQDAGADKPDGHVRLPDGSIAHLEAEHATLSKPAKVLKNYVRAAEAGRECIFVVEEGNVAKLQNIVEDPKNRRGDEYEDEKGSYSYYLADGEPFTDFEGIRDSDYRILEISEDDLEVHNDTVEVECPELDRNERGDLEQFCLHRDDGFCTALETECVLLEDP